MQRREKDITRREAASTLALRDARHLWGFAFKSQNPHPFGFAQGTLCRTKRDKDGVPGFSQLFGPAAEEESAVGAAEAEGVGHSVFEAGFAGVVGDEIHAGRVGVGVLEIDGGWQDLVAQGEYRDARFETAGAAEEMSGHGLGGTYSELVISKEIANSVSFQRVTDRGRCAVRVYVVNDSGGNSSIAHRIPHDAETAFVLGSGLRDVVGIA